jgi:hypothetical protein
VQTVYIGLDDNPNCGAWAGQVFQCEDPRPVAAVRYERAGALAWFDVTGLDSDGQPCPALAGIVQDSGDGACHLLFGGTWGLRFKPASSAAWDLADAGQWGEPFLILPADPAGLRFQL